MNEDFKNKIEKSIDESIKKISALGLNGQVLHPHLRAVFTAMRIKKSDKEEHKIENVLKKLDDDIKKHLVISAEQEEVHAVTEIVKELTILYLIFDALLLYEKHDFEELKSNINDIKKFIDKKIQDKNLTKEIHKAIDSMINDWDDELEHLKKHINSIWATSQGRVGFANAFFDNTHKQGYFVRMQERKHFRDALKSESTVEQLLDKLPESKDRTSLEKTLKDVHDIDTKVVRDFEILFKLLESTWDKTNGLLGDLIKKVNSAVSEKELPESDSKEMIDIQSLIANRLNEKFLHSLRIEEKQLEAELKNVKDNAKKL